ncbi:E3 ubiquitin-protein ligase TRIM21-like [Cyprinodon tularosa]|uniref:E3 ubiquitin-protein ligase TRIM21-like n=1 Tax=Cyprinodon tularosa TaxID=77115 RepID=UPI0018E20BCC|nr:E3 ubiquitin-protein ligase TRIM21-like [Cyprinodon tularosa]
MSGILSPTSSIMEDENPGAEIMPEQILNTLDELNKKELKRFKSILQQPTDIRRLPTLKWKNLKKRKTIKKTNLEKAKTIEKTNLEKAKTIGKKNLEKVKSIDVADLMLQTYTHNRCLEVTYQILKKIKRKDLRQKLIDAQKEELKRIEAEVDQMIHDTGVQIREIKESVKISKDAADREKAEGVEVFTALKESAERGLKELIKEIEDKQKTEEKKTKDWIKYLQQEIHELSGTNLFSPSNLLQSFPSLKAAPPTKDLTEVRVRPPTYKGTVVRAVAQLENKLRKSIQEIMDAEMKRVQKFAVDVSLDPDTAHPYLILSVDGKQVNVGEVEYHLPGNPKRFSESLAVLGRQSFSSGRFYFEVQVKGKTGWVLGVASESIDRKGEIKLSPKNGYWTVRLKNRNNYKACADPPVRLHLHPGPEKVGVFVDYEEGQVSFYDVDGLIYSFTGCCFTEKLYPYFSHYDNVGGENSAPLIICPVNQADCSSDCSSDEELIFS